MVYIIFCKINNILEEHIKMGGRAYIGDENIKNKIIKKFFVYCILAKYSVKTFLLG